MPGLVLYTVDHRLYPYPEDRTLTYDAIDLWLKELYLGMIKKFDYEPEVLMADDEINDLLLNNTIKANLFDYKYQVLAYEVDALVFIYSTARLTNI